MKKWIATAVAAGALAAGGAASAQDLGSVIANIFGYGTPQYSYGGPAVVAGAGQLYQDAYGRQFYYDQYGRQVFVNNGSTQQIIGYDQWGRPVYGTQQYGWGNSGYTYGGNYAYGNRSWDIDGDGIANSRDRWPNDSRYY